MADQNTQRTEVISKTRAQIECVRKLTDSRYHGIIGSDRTAELQIMLKKLEALCNKLERNTFDVSIVGLEKTGKSTFANAFMGIDILPTKDARCTYTATNICYGNDDKAEVKFFSKEEFNENFFIRLNSIGVQTDGMPDNWYDWDQDMLDKAYSAVESKNSDTDNVKNDLSEIIENRNSLRDLLDRPMTEFSGDALEIEIKDYIAAPAKALAVKEITIHSSKLSAMKNAQLYDVPGFDSPTQIHKEQTRAWMKKSDAIILVVNASAPSFTESIVRFFETIDKDDDGISIGEKLFVFGNKADMAATISENVEKIKSELKKYRIMPESLIDGRLTKGSAKAHIDMEKADGDEAERIMSALKEKGLDSDGIVTIRDMLIDYNDTDRLNVMTRRVINMKNRVEALLNAIKAENEISDDSSVDLEMEDLVDELKRNARSRINVEVSTYEGLAITRCKTEKPITAKIRENVISKIEPSEYRITDEEINTQKSQYLANSDIKRAEGDVRQVKYKKMYDGFIENVVNLAVDEYNESEAALIEAFEKGLDISKTNPYYDELHEAVRNYIVSVCSNTAPEGYYSSLIRRYSGNLFEILIACPFSDDIRFDKFNEEKKNFYSLSLFEDSADERLDPTTRPMHYQMLFHELLEASGSADMEISEKLILKAEKKIGEIIPAQTELHGLIKDFAAAHGDNAESDFDNVLSNLSNTAAEDEKGIPLFAIVPNPMREKLVSLLKGDKPVSANSVHTAAFSKEKYREFFKSYEKDIEKIKDEFNTDIEILKAILSNQVMNATAIEIPFLDLVHQNVTSIKESLEKADFTSFINRKKELILDEKYKRLKSEHERKAMQAEIIHEIESIVKESD